MNYWRDNGTPSEKLRMGFPAYGRTFRLTSTDTSVGAPANGPASAGPFTREAGFWAYYEVMCIVCRKYKQALIIEMGYKHDLDFLFDRSAPS